MAKKTINTHSKDYKYLYIFAIGVVLIPLLLLGYVYISTKENANTPTVGSRFNSSLDPAITQEQIDKIESSLKSDDIESVEINLKSATLRITIDLKDDANNDKVTSTIKDTYNKVIEVLPEKTYFTNKENCRMYDLDIHVYNFIPKEDNTKGWVYKEMIKNAASEKASVDTLSSPRNKKTANKLLNPKKDKAEDKKDKEEGQ